MSEVKNIPKDDALSLPKGWVETTLGALAYINPRESLPKGAFGTNIPMDCIDSFSKKIQRYNLSAFKGGTKFRNGDTLLARITPCLENGKTAFVDILKENEIGFGSTEYIVIREKKDISDKHFLFYLSISPRFREVAIKAMTGTSGRQRVQTDMLVNHKFNLPLLPEQKSIAAILTAFDDKIELLQAQNKTLEKTAQTIFKEWFGKYQIDDKLPEGWRVGSVGDLIEIKRGGSPRPIQDFISDKGYRWLKISDATATPSPYIFNIKEHIISEGLKKTVLKKAGDIVLSNSATPGMPKILAVDTCIHDGWLHFPTSKVSNEYLYLLFMNIRPALVQQGSGSVFTNLKTDILREFPIVIPEPGLFSKLDKVTKPIFEKLYINTSQIQTLTQTRDALLPKLMSGEIRVNDFKN